MVLFAADGDEENAEQTEQAEQADTAEQAEDQAEEQEEKIDTAALTADLPDDSEKVELDLDDAPFLMDDEEEEEEEEQAEEAAQEEPEPVPWYKKKKIVLSLIGGGFLLLALVAFFVLKPAPRPDISAPEAEPEPAPQEYIPEPEEEEPFEFKTELAPFFIEHEDSNGVIRFLVCKFSLVVIENERLSVELSQKTTTLRDAIYYYLKNKDMTFLADRKNVKKLKEDVLSVVNQYVSNGRVETLLIEQYVVK